MKNFIWKVLLYLILVLEIFFLWRGTSRLIRTYEETIGLLTVLQPRLCRYEKPKAENKVSKPASKPVNPRPSDNPVPYLTPNTIPSPPPPNLGPLPPNGPSGQTTYETPQPVGGLPPN